MFGLFIIGGYVVLVTVYQKFWNKYFIDEISILMSKFFHLSQYHLYLARRPVSFPISSLCNS